jgi:phosphopantetheinyl transferase
VGVMMSQIWTDENVLLTFPNAIERLEFVASRPRGRPLRAVTCMRRETVPDSGDGRKRTRVFSDVEMCAEDGRVVLRATGRDDEEVRVPGRLYGYWPRPRGVHFSRSIDGLFRDVPGIAGCRMCHSGGEVFRLLIQDVWSKTCAWMILSAAERRRFADLAMAPVPAASWLLGRAAAKDAVRLQGSRDLCMADVTITADAHGRPLVEAENAPLLSLAHKSFSAVAVAADPRPFAGVGIDLEPIGNVSAVVRESAFDAGEHAVLEKFARAAADECYPAAWCAKEAVAKAVGLGLADPLSVKIAALDTHARRFSCALRGPLAAAVPAYASRAHQRLDVHWRVVDRHVVALCLLPREANDVRLSSSPVSQG